MLSTVRLFRAKEVKRVIKKVRTNFETFLELGAGGIDFRSAHFGLLQSSLNVLRLALSILFVLTNDTFGCSLHLPDFAVAHSRLGASVETHANVASSVRFVVR